MCRRVAQLAAHALAMTSVFRRHSPCAASARHVSASEITSLGIISGVVPLVVTATFSAVVTCNTTRRLELTKSISAGPIFITVRAIAIQRGCITESEGAQQLLLTSPGAGRDEGVPDRGGRRARPATRWPWARRRPPARGRPRYVASYTCLNINRKAAVSFAAFTHILLVNSTITALQPAHTTVLNISGNRAACHVSAACRRAGAS